MKRALSIILVLVTLLSLGFTVNAETDKFDKIREDYLKHINNNRLTYEDVIVVEYYGCFNGYECVVMDVAGSLHNMAVGKAEIGNMIFSFSIGDYAKTFYLYADGRFITVKAAYDIGIIDDYDLYQIAKAHGNFEWADYIANTDKIFTEDLLIFVFDTETGTMAVVGEGRMDNYDDHWVMNYLHMSPLFMNDKIKTVIIEEGLTYVGSYFFNDCPNLEKVVFPKTLQDIGFCAFNECPKITRIEFPEGIKELTYTGIGFPDFMSDENNLKEIVFNGNAPVIDICGPFLNFKGKVYYPYNNPTWTEEKMKEYEAIDGAEIEWISWYDNGFSFAYNKFDDVGYKSWYTPAVQFVYEKGIMSGMSHTEFSPSTYVTREQLMQVLFALSSPDISEYLGESGFSDVAENKWFSHSVKWAKTMGITSGINEDEFGLGRYVTREQLATFILNYAEYAGCAVYYDGSIPEYSDADKISPWAKNGMSFCISNGIINGRANGCLDPKAPATRAELAQIFRMFITSGFLYRVDFHSDNACDVSFRYLAKGARIGYLPFGDDPSFDAWYYNGMRISEDSVFNFNSDITIEALWK